MKSIQFSKKKVIRNLILSNNFVSIYTNNYQHKRALESKKYKYIGRNKASDVCGKMISGILISSCTNVRAKTGQN